MGMISDGVLQLAVNSSMLLRKVVFFSVFLLLIMKIEIKTSLLMLLVGSICKECVQKECEI